MKKIIHTTTAITCLVCKNDTIEQVVQDNRTMYYCQTCNRLYERAFDMMRGIDVIINSEEGISHVTAGGLVRRGNQFLLLKRRAYPFGYTFPAGHVQYDEKPQDAAKREIFEETGLRVVVVKELYEGVMDTKCRYGGDSHVWHFFECQSRSGTPFLNPESESIGWYTRDEAIQLDLIPSARFLINKVVHE